MKGQGMTIYTIGHSTCDQEEVYELLFAKDVDLLVDIRSYPSSRHCPQWNKGAIEADLPDWLDYTWEGELLGGRRKVRVYTPETAYWHNASFRSYAEFMRGPAFWSGVARLEALAKNHTIALMCAEAVWWRCHRSMVADALTLTGVEVVHLMNHENPRATLHTRKIALLGPDGRVAYPEQSSEEESDK